MLIDVSIERVEDGYSVKDPHGTRRAKDLRELELIMRGYQVFPKEWNDLKDKLLNTGRASLQISSGKLSMRPVGLD